MKGLELSRGYYQEYGARMIHETFPTLEEMIAVGLVGDGSECFGFDDEVSRDHDFDPGFCLFLPDGEDIIDSQTQFRLERAYAALPKEYQGVPRLKISPVGGERHGVIRIGDFYEAKIGSKTGFSCDMDWFHVPEHYLAQAVNGEVFRDDLGTFSAIRQSLSSYPPDVHKKKLAGHLLLMAQAGQYNYVRCLKHGEKAAAQLAVGEFVNHAMAAAFMLNHRYMPYYKWSFRALGTLPVLGNLAETLELLLTTDNDDTMAAAKAEVIEDVADMVITQLHEQDLTAATCGDLEKHAYSVNDKISDSHIRNLNILYAV